MDRLADVARQNISRVHARDVSQKFEVLLAEAPLCQDAKMRGATAFPALVCCESRRYPQARIRCEVDPALESDSPLICVTSSIAGNPLRPKIARCSPWNRSAMKSHEPSGTNRRSPS